MFREAIVAKRESGVPAYLKVQVLERDGHKCVKCGRHKHLEVHHIFPVYRDGPDIEFNLITLCDDCHRNSPDTPIEFIKYCAHHLPDEFYRSSQITKLIACIILADLQVYEVPPFNSRQTLDDYTARQIDVSNMQKRFNVVNERVNELYKLFWQAFLDDSTAKFSQFMDLLSSKRDTNGAAPSSL